MMCAMVTGASSAPVTIAGHTAIEENCYIGNATSIMNHLTIGAGALVGLGSNVVRDVSVERWVAGNPAREMGG